MFDKFRMGLWIDKTKITKHALVNAIHEILTNPRFGLAKLYLLSKIHINKRTSNRTFDSIRFANLIKKNWLKRKFSYKQRAKELSALLVDEPKRARARFLRGVERAAHFPALGHALKLPSMEMRPFVYYNLDILAAAIAVLLTVSTVSFYAIKLTISRLNSLLKHSRFWTHRETTNKYLQQRKND